MSRTIFHGPKKIQAIKFNYTTENNFLHKDGSNRFSLIWGPVRHQM